MNLLVITNNPDRASFKQRIGAYIGILRTNGINCEVAKLPAGSLARCRLFKRAADFDGVLLHKKLLNPLDAVWLRGYSRKIIYNFDDAVMYHDKYPDRDSASHFRGFRRSVKLADMVITASSYLAEPALKLNQNVQVLPIGLAVGNYKSSATTDSNGKIRLVWIGSAATLQYLAEIKPALEETGAHFDNLILRIICDDFFDLQNMQVEKRLWSEESRAGSLATSDIGLAPLPDNRFTRGKCSFKVLEYGAARLPVIASPVGTNLDYVLDGVTGLFARNLQEWTTRITQLAEDPQLREKMGQAGSEQAKKFDVSIIGRQFVELVSNCLRDAHDGPIEKPTN
ncbi:MAG: glycosyltransferase family 4 protein [Planctomycetota bacterium]|nr:MAG: glycosyltransferase family 4 protein [Planctomycetota bacterium]